MREARDKKKGRWLLMVVTIVVVILVAITAAYRYFKPRSGNFGDTEMDAKAALQQQQNPAKHRDVQRIFDLGNLKIGMEMYYSDYNQYPSYNFDIAKTLRSYISTSQVSRILPTSNGQYVYCVDRTLQRYALATRLEGDTSAIRKHTLSVIQGITGTNADATYVVGPNPELVTTAATIESPAQCSDAGGVIQY